MDARRPEDWTKGIVPSKAHLRSRHDIPKVADQQSYVKCFASARRSLLQFLPSVGSEGEKEKVTYHPAVDGSAGLRAGGAR